MLIRKTPFFPEAKEDADRVYGKDPLHNFPPPIDDVAEDPLQIFEDYESKLLNLKYVSTIFEPKTGQVNVALIQEHPVPVSIRLLRSSGCISVFAVPHDASFIEDELDEDVLLEFMAENRMKILSCCEYHARLSSKKTKRPRKMMNFNKKKVATKEKIRKSRKFISKMKYSDL